MNRREFLHALTISLSAAGISLPILPAMAAGAGTGMSSLPVRALASSRGQPGNGPARHLVLIELQGGNDGLNTVVPYADPDYLTLRPVIGLRRDSVIALDERTGLHPALDPLLRLWNRGDMAVIQGVGYPHPNRSHFRSIEIWETASDANQTLMDGWLRPVMDALPGSRKDSIKAVALALDEGPLAGATGDTVVFNDLDGFVRQASELTTHRSHTANQALAHLLAVENTTRTATQVFAEQLESTDDRSSSSLPKNTPKLTRQLDLIAGLIHQDLGARIYKVELGSFDTHANQLQRHQALLQQLAEAVAHLQKTLDGSGLWENVLVMTYSEFGRRASENGSGGTDHGTAAPHFMFGGSVKGGIYGEAPCLGSLVNGDVMFTTDFRALYSTVSRNWFGQALVDTPYSAFDTLPVLRNTL